MVTWNVGWECYASVDALGPYVPNGDMEYLTMNLVSKVYLTVKDSIESYAMKDLTKA